MIVDMIIRAMIEKLTLDCQANIPESDPSRARVVKDGRLQDDPEEAVVSLLVHPNYPAGSDRGWPHTADPDRAEFGAIGRKRRFSVEISCFFTQQGLSREEATKYSSRVLGRVESALSDSQAIADLLTDDDGNYTLVDEFGETFEAACGSALQDSWMVKGGGEGEWNVRGYVLVEYATTRYA